MTRPVYHDFERVEDVPARFDIVEIKLDGIYCEMLIDKNGKVKMKNRHGEVFEERFIGRWPKGLGAVVLVGEYMAGTTRSAQSKDHGSVICFDVLAVFGQDVRDEKLSYRRDALERLFRYLESTGGRYAWLTMGKQDKREAAGVFWNFRVLRGSAEGLVFKSSRGYWGDDWARVKKRVTVDYVLIRTERTKNGRTTLVGGVYKGGRLCEVARVHTRVPVGLNAPQGTVFEASGNQLNQSGALRHPRFERIRTDKNADECRMNGVK